ncbi:hypothetical protein VPH35_063117 [Triticum aestivum]
MDSIDHAKASNIPWLVPIQPRRSIALYFCCRLIILCSDIDPVKATAQSSASIATKTVKKTLFLWYRLIVLLLQWHKALIVHLCLNYLHAFGNSRTMKFVGRSIPPPAFCPWRTINYDAPLATLPPFILRYTVFFLTAF